MSSGYKDCHSFTSGDVEFIFSLALLRGNNWHYNRNWNFGIIGHFTKFPDELLQNPSSFERTGGDEFVFHDSVPLSLCDRIIVSDSPGKRTNYTEILKYCRRYQPNIDVISKHDMIPSHRNLIGLYSDPPMYANNLPYYVYYEGVSLMLEDYNVNGHDIDDLHPTLIEQLRRHHLELIGLDYNSVKDISDDDLVRDIRKKLVAHVISK
jgi:hypothetical protein